MKGESLKKFKANEAAPAEGQAAKPARKEKGVEMTSVESRAEFLANMSRDEDKMLREGTKGTGGFLEKINKLPKGVKKYAMSLLLAGTIMAGYEAGTAKEAEAQEQQTQSMNEANKISPERQAAWNEHLAQIRAIDQQFAQEMARINQTYQMKKFDLANQTRQGIFSRVPGSIGNVMRQSIELENWRQQEVSHQKQMRDSQIMQSRQYFEMRAQGK